MLNPAELKRKITKLQNKLLKLNAFLFSISLSPGVLFYPEII